MTPSKKKRRQYSQELVCGRCDTSLDNTQIYCYECGEPTDVLKNDLSAFKTIKSVWESYSPGKSRNFSFSIFYFFVLLVPLFLLVFNNHNIYRLVSSLISRLQIPVPGILSGHGLYLLTNLLLLIFLPLLFIPFSFQSEGGKGSFKIDGYFSRLNDYPMYFLFILLNVVYFFLLKVITTSVDPILNLVRFIMVLYWLAIVVPLPHFMAHKRLNIWKSWLAVYKGGKETRWQQFFILLFCTVINAIGLALLGLGLLITIPFTISVLEAYYLRMEQYNLFAEYVRAPSHEPVSP